MKECRTCFYWHKIKDENIGGCFFSGLMAKGDMGHYPIADKTTQSDSFCRFWKDEVKLT